MASFPSLAKLPNSTGVFPSSDKTWAERDDLVVGGCDRTSPCFEQWREALLNEAFLRDEQDTIILLSVGAGVLEMLALRTIWEMRPKPLKRVWLIDPGIDRAESEEVTKEMKDFLPGVDVRYFWGEAAYEDIMAQLPTLGENSVVAVAGLNLSLGLLGSPVVSMQNRLKPLALVERLYVRAGNNNRAGTRPMRVVVAYTNENGEGVRMRPRADYWLATEKERLTHFIYHVSKAEVAEFDRTDPEARGD